MGAASQPPAQPCGGREGATWHASPRPSSCRCPHPQDEIFAKGARQGEKRRFEEEKPPLVEFKAGLVIEVAVSRPMYQHHRMCDPDRVEAPLRTRITTCAIL